MSRSASFGIVTGVMEPLRTVVVTVLLATFMASALAKKGVNNGDAAVASLQPGTSASVFAPTKSVKFTDSVLANDQQASPSTSISYTNPVLAGNYPDPSVIRVGKHYWATATSSGWAPQFPILHSRDLVNWEIVGSVFQQSPVWSDGNYWAPEITQHRGRSFIYYVAQKKDGPRCIAVATARHPIGPYTDHGPVVCQEQGSIDPMAVTDEHGERYLVWKAGGNAHNLPTLIWAQKLSRDGLSVIGKRTELIRNDASWEAKVVEAPFIVRRDGWFYMFYSGDDCCSLQCNYALGVARSPYLLGPWEKNPANPILKGNKTWKCPGHGSVVTDTKGHDYLLYHAFQRESVYVGRQALLDEVQWSAGQWPTINNANATNVRVPSPHSLQTRNAEYAFLDNFTSSRLLPGWQWPQANAPSTRMVPARSGWLALSPASARAQDVIGAVVARPTTNGDYVATTVADMRGLQPGALAGLAAYGDRENGLGMTIGDGKVTVWRRENNEHKTVAQIAAPNSPLVHLRMTAMDGHQFRFAVSPNGQDWIQVGDKRGNDLPPWDHAVRIALTSGGIEGAAARFDSLRVVPSDTRPTLLAAGS